VTETEGDIGVSSKVCPNCGESVKGFVLVDDEFLVFEPGSKDVDGAIVWYECPNCGVVDLDGQKTE